MPLRGSKVEGARSVFVIASEREDPPRIVVAPPHTPRVAPPQHTEFPLWGVDVCAACC
jgi:hypothetical protein